LLVALSSGSPSGHEPRPPVQTPQTTRTMQRSSAISYLDPIRIARSIAFDHAPPAALPEACGGVARRRTLGLMALQPGHHGPDEVLPVGEARGMDAVDVEEHEADREVGETSPQPLSTSLSPLRPSFLSAKISATRSDILAEAQSLSQGASSACATQGIEAIAAAMRTRRGERRDPDPRRWPGMMTK
jgi:hypothetical protein